MNLAAIVTHLETIPTLAGRVVVGIPAQMESLSAAPYVWVTSVMEGGGDSPITGPVRQKIELRVELTVGARNLESMLDIRDQVWASMLNFQVDSGHEPMAFRIGRMEFGDPGWFLWRDEFRTSYFKDTR